MSCKSWWWRGDGNLEGISGDHWSIGDGGNDTVDARAGLDFICTRCADDAIDGGDGLGNESTARVAVNGTPLAETTSLPEQVYPASS